MSKVVFLGGMKGLGLEMAILAERRQDAVTVTRSSSRRRPSVLLADQIECNLDLRADFDAYLAAPAGTPAGPWDAIADAIAACDTFVWVAGIWLRHPFHVSEWYDKAEVLTVQFAAPAQILHAALRKRLSVPDPKPIHIVVISSSSAWKVRGDGQAMYGAAQAAKAQFARNLCAELQTSLPGSMVTLACPGGMRTDLFYGEVDTTNFMDPAAVAAQIWTATDLPHENGLLEMHLSGTGDDIQVAYGPKLPA